MQKLFAPYRYLEVLAGYKVPAYLKYWGYAHYGWDVTSVDSPVEVERKKILALGNGTVKVVGLDSRVGNVVVIEYPDCELYDGSVKSLVARCFHLASIIVKTGQAVTNETVIGIEGNTGTGGIHLHVELDTDIKYPTYSPQVAGGSIIKKGKDTSVDPANVFYKRSDGVVIPSRYGTEWNTKADALQTATTPQTDVLLLEQINTLTEQNKAQAVKIALLEKKLSEVKEFVIKTI